MRTCAALALLLVSGAANAEVLDYDYVYLSRNGTESDGNGSGGGFKSFGGHTHVFASYDDTAFYAGRHDDWDYDLQTLRVGAGGHYLIGERTMIAPSLSVFRSRGEAKAPSWDEPRELEGTGYIAQFDLRHAVTDWLEITAAARLTRFDGDSATEMVGGVMFHATDNWAFGALYHHRDGGDTTELTVRYYY
ncbi:hypothetical protein QAA18_02045 [Luteimonas sp. 8-5]|uniref:hypothetical protein n=1 Tax=Luteimonas sp. 8-5 TaxID=3039387 RepID=UPI0024369CC9|nr:hypothetical protein [Luteimonas sp. 8-5]MDG6347531.1 hypothetical protein [Luteimonas sp. 8-5]